MSSASGHSLSIQNLEPVLSSSSSRLVADQMSSPFRPDYSLAARASPVEDAESRDMSPYHPAGDGSPRRYHSAASHTLSFSPPTAESYTSTTCDHIETPRLDHEVYLARIASVHSLKDIPYVGNSSMNGLDDDLAGSSSATAYSSNDILERDPQTGHATRSSSTPPSNAAYPILSSSQQQQQQQQHPRHHERTVSTQSQGSVTTSLHNPKVLSRSFSGLSIVTALNGNDTNDTQSRTGHPLGETPLEIIEHNDHSPKPSISIGDNRETWLLLKSLSARRTAVENQLAFTSKGAINTFVLASLYERYNYSLSSLVNTLSHQEPLDIQVFSQLFHQIQEIRKHMLRIGPMGNILPQASKLTEIIKWDYRQLINSYLTLLRTSPGFVATAYLEMDSRGARAFLGRPASTVDDVVSSQRHCVLGTLYYGILRDKPQRVNYFAALATEVLFSSNDENIVNACFSLFCQQMHTLSDTTIHKLDNLLLNVIRKGYDCRLASTSRTYSITHSDPLSNVTEECWNQFCSEFIDIILLDNDLKCTYFTELVVQMREMSPLLSDRIDRLALRYYRALLRQIILSPHRYGLLSGFYIGDAVQKTALNPLATHFSSSFKQESFGKLLKQTVLGYRSKRNAAKNEESSFFEAGQIMVVSLSELVYTFDCLFKHNRRSVRGSQRHDGSDDESEWCLESIQSDLEPVMKELLLKLPHAKAALSRQSQVGLFADYWQVFRIHADGLVTDIDDSSWDLPTSSLESVWETLKEPELTVQELLENSAQSASQSSDFVGALRLNNLLDGDMAKSCDYLVNSLESEVRMAEEMHTSLLDSLRNHKLVYAQQLKLNDVITKLFNDLRLHLWYEQEVRNSAIWQRSCDNIANLKGAATRQRANSSSSISSTYKRYSSKRRLSILSSGSGYEGQFVIRDYLHKPKLTDREVETALDYLRQGHIRNICQSEESLHRFMAEIQGLSRQLLDKSFLSSSSTAYKRDIKRTRHGANSNHRMSMSVLTDLRSPHNGMRSSSLLDIFEWKNEEPSSTTRAAMLGLVEDDGSNLPSYDQVCGLLLTDLGQDYLYKGSETDEFMQQTGRIVLDGDGAAIQSCLTEISRSFTPATKLAGFSALVRYLTAMITIQTGILPSRADVAQKLAKVLGREGTTLYFDLQLVSGLSLRESLDHGEVAESFWDVFDAADKILGNVISKSIDLALRMLRYQSETVESTATVEHMAVNDAVSILSFCARSGSPEAQRRLSQLYLEYPYTHLDLYPLSRVGNLLDQVDATQIRESVANHWLRLAAQGGDVDARELFSSGHSSQ